MDKKFHSKPHLSCLNRNIDKHSLDEEFSSTFLFEPKGFIDYEIAWKWQKERRKALFNNFSSSQSVFLLQHQSCYTMGRGSSEKNILFNLEDPPYAIHRIDRGGEVTHHLPGQLVVYLVLDLARYQTDLHWYLRKLEEVLIDFLESIGLKGEIVSGMTGVWCEGFKVASIGVGCRKWVTQHGFSLNVDCDMKGFEQIIPCGLNGEKIGNISYWKPGLTVEIVKPIIKKSLQKQFGFVWKEIDSL